MNRGFLLLLFVGMLTTKFVQAQQTVSGQEYNLFSNQKTNYKICLVQNPSPSEQWAAKELQHWLKAVSGADFPIQNAGELQDGPRIVVGYDERMNPGKPAPDSLDESFRYFNSGADIFIFGGRKRGTMYGVMSFLENELGCRWYTPAVSVIPKKETLTFRRYNHSESPGIRVRNDFYFEAFDPVWAARNKMNGRMEFVEQPGGVEAYWSVHTFYPLMPPSEFFDKHPEYYSLIDGTRIHERAQLCLSNADVLKIITERIKKKMRDNPQYLIYSVSQNDWYNPCQCNKCQSIVKKEGSESGPMIWFVNQVAKSVEKEFPDKYIGTLAYQYTRTPPRNLRPRNNVVIRLCPIEACVAHSLENCPQNQSFLKDLKTWSSISPHLYIWDYVVNFAHYVMPYPNFQVLQPNIKTFQQNKAIGIMEQAAYQSRGGEFSELKAYLIARLLWNPDCNVERVVDDFMYGYYGRSGEYIREYFDLLLSRITPATHIHIGLKPDDAIFSEELVNQATTLFEKAIIVADNDEIRQRVEMASLPLLYLKCKRTPLIARNDGSYENFKRIAEREKVTHYSESWNETLTEENRIRFNTSVENAQ